MEELNDKQKAILKILKDLKEGESLATSKIAFLISSNLYLAEKYLEELLEKNLIEKYEKNNATYWRLKNE